MIVQCEQCRTKFRLDDGKVSDRGVKVRCAKCRHVFTVRKTETAGVPETVTAPGIPAVDDVWAPAQETADASVLMSAVAPPDQTQQDGMPKPGMTIDFGAPPPDDTTPPVDTGQSDASAGGLDFGAISFGTEPAAPPPAQDAAEFDVAQTGAAAGSVDFTDLPLGAEPAATPAMAADTGIQEPPPLPASALNATEAGSTPSAFNFSAFDAHTAQPASETAAPPAEDKFGLGDIDFGGDTVPAASATPPPASGSAADSAAPAPVAPEITFEANAPKAEEAPPLSISSRRRRSPLLSILLTILGVLVAGIAGFMAYTHLSDDPGAFKLFDKPRVPAEEGRISVRKVNAAYLEQAAAGELLVISGEAVNNFTKTRAALQLKGMIFGGDGAVLISKVAYAGNTLTHEQLRAMPLDKIEAAMNNQFGDSLINLEVQPGKAIPFTIVIVNPPKEGREFGVEAAGSTVAVSK